MFEEHMFEQCPNRTYVRGKSFLEELHELGYRSHFERSSVGIYETVERAKVQIGLAPEFAALECFRSCNCRKAEKSTQLSSQWVPHVPFHVRGMFAPCSRHVRAMGFGSATISSCEVAATRPKKNLPKSSPCHIQNACSGMFENICSGEHMFEVFETMFEACSQCSLCSRATVSHFGMFVNICSIMFDEHMFEEQKTLTMFED